MIFLHVGESISGGGAGTVLRETVEILKKNDTINTHKVLVRKSNFYENKIDYTFSKPPTSKFKFVDQIFSIKNFVAINKVLQSLQPDVIHIQSLGNLSPSIFLALKKYKNKNRVTIFQTVHTFEYLCSHSAGYDYLKQKKCTDCATNLYKFKIFARRCSRLGFIHSYAKGLTSFLYSNFVKNNLIDQIITPSNFLRKKMLLHPEIKSIEVLYNPVKSNNQIKLNNNTKLHNKFRFVFFGRLSEEKNIECIIEAFSIAVKENPFFELVIIGSGPQENKLRKLTDKLALTEKVIFKGFLEKKALTRELLNCNVSILSSKCYETASMVVLESIQYNLLPIVCDHGGMKEMVESVGVGLKFMDGDIYELSKKMKESYINNKKTKSELFEIRDKVLFDYGDLSYFINLNKIYNKRLFGADQLS